MLKTRSGLPRHCTYEVDRYGKRRVRFRRRGVSVYLTGIPWSEAFMRQYAAALEREQGQGLQIGVARTNPGSFSALCVSYYSSTEFRDLKPSSQAERRGVLDRFRADHGHRLYKDLQRVHIRSIVTAKADTPGAANNLLKALRVILNYAVSQDLIPANPALGVKRLRSRNPEGHHTWTEDEIARFQTAHPLNTRAGLALALLLYTGQRRGDIITMGWQHTTKDGRVVVRQRKTGRVVSIPIHPELARALAQAPKTDLTFIKTARDVPFSPMGFTNWFRRMCIAAGLPRACSPHGLRKAACRRLAEAGCSANEIAAISGHASLKEVTRYTAAADREHLADQAIARQLRAQNKRRSNLPNTPIRVYPTAKKR